MGLFGVYGFNAWVKGRCRGCLKALIGSALENISVYKIRRASI